MQKIAIPETFQNRPYARENFARIVDWAASEHPFYQKHLVEPSVEVPLLTREQIRNDNLLLLNGHPPSGRTSGSTGVPVEIAWSPSRVVRERKVHQMTAQWFGGALPRVRIVGRGELKGDPHAIDVCLPLEEQMAFIQSERQQRQIKALVTYPSNAVNLSQYAAENNVDLSFIERVVCYAECFDESHLLPIQTAFPSARVWTTYSCSEAGTVAVLCPFDQTHHHIMAQNLGVEILDDNNQPCEAGQIGRVVITDYFNTYMPLIRYEIGDLAIAGQCPCGQIKLPSLRKVLGKVRGSLKRLDGSPIMFANIAVTLRDMEGLKQYQVIQEQIDQIRFRYVIDKGYDEQLMQQMITQEMNEYLGFQANYTFVRESEIGREPSGKFHASICRV